MNSGFIVGENKTLIVDSGCNYFSAETIFGYAKSVKPDNEFLVINTEKHLDHLGGNSFFKKKGIDILGHKMINRHYSDIDKVKEFFNSSTINEKRKNCKEGYILFEDTEIVNPNIRIDADLDIDLGKISAKIVLTPGHTDTNLSVFIPSEKVFFCGDCIVNQFIPNLEEGDVILWNTWLNSLEKISDLPFDTLAPGHGRYISGRNKIDEEIQRIKNIIKEAIDKQKAPTL